MSSNRTVPVGPASGPGPCTRVTIDSPPPQSMQQHLDPQHFNTDGNFDTSTSQNAYSAASATRKRALLREVVTVLGLKMCRHHTLRSGAFGPRVVKLVASMLLPLPPPWWHSKSLIFSLFHFHCRLEVQRRVLVETFCIDSTS